MEKNEMKENKENVVIALIADFFKRVDRQGPGGEAAGFLELLQAIIRFLQ